MSLGLWAVVLLAGGVMALLRFAVASWAAGHPRTSALEGFPAAVLAVNAIGSLIAGLAVGFATAGAISDSAKVVLVSGVAAGLTTFSTFNVETIQAFTSGRYRIAATSIAANWTIGLVLVFAGYHLGLAL